MALFPINDTHLDVRVTGDGPDTILFIHGLMLASDSWQAQVAHFAQTHRVITFDLRGQGRSDHPRHGLDLETLTEDAAAVLRQFSDGPAHVVGFSMGAFIALRLGARYPQLVRSLSLIGPSARAEERHNAPRYAAMIALVTLFGPRVLVGQLMQILFGSSFLGDPARAAEAAKYRATLVRLPRSLARAAAASAKRKAITYELAAITAPTLVISGAEDRPVPPPLAIAVHEAIAGSRFIGFPETGHAVQLERPDAFNAALAEFLTDVAKVEQGQ